MVIKYQKRGNHHELPGLPPFRLKYPDTSIARSKNCGYLLDPYVFGLKSSSSSSANLQRSKRSKLLAKIAFSGSILLFIASICMHIPVMSHSESGPCRTVRGGKSAVVGIVP